MKIIIEKEINGITVIIAVNNNNELKIGSIDSYNDKHMSAFTMGDDMWFGIGHEFLHTSVNNDEIFCNIGTNLSIENIEFPYELLNLSEIDKINEAINFKY